MTFLHGVETIERTIGARQIRGVSTAVIGLVGTAPIWQIDSGDQRLNVPVLITSQADAEQYFGSAVSGYTIPQAIAAIFAQGNGLIIAVNVFDPASMHAAVALANHVLDVNDQVILANQGVSAVVVKDSSGATTYVVNTDYTVDAVNGIVKRVSSGAILSGATIKIGYNRPDVTMVTNNEIVGAVVSGARTGAQALLDAKALFGFGPKILIAPAFSTQKLVATALETLAEPLRAIALVDEAAGTIFADALTDRADATKSIGTASYRVGACYPYVTTLDPVSGLPVTEPMSQRLAGAIAAKDLALGFHYSPSNTALAGVIGLERPLTFTLNDPTCEVNLLNGAGLITAVNVSGEVRAWGNHSAAFPSESDVETFIAVRRVADVVEESIEAACLQFMDQPINNALVDTITASVNAFMRSLIGRGALIDGRCTYDPANNPAEELAAGHITFDYSFMPPVPAERITFRSFVDISLLSQIGAPAS